MNAKNQSYSSSHLVKKCFSATILSYEDGKFLHYDPGSQMVGNIFGLGQRGMV
jgi:hypothetical protein